MYKVYCTVILQPFVAESRCLHQSAQKSTGNMKGQISGFMQVRENWKRSGNLSGQGKCKSDWKVREILGENFTFLYSCCNANNSGAGVQSTILLAVVVCIR